MVNAPLNLLGVRRLAVAVLHDVTAGAHAPPDPGMLWLGAGLIALPPLRHPAWEAWVPG